jgi:hypothetical protein
MEDFASAAVRHWQTTDRLASEGSWQQAAYLAGYVAECSLKSLLERTTTTIMPKAVGHDLARLVGDALELAWILAPATRRYPIPPISSGAPGIGEWRPEHRYARTGFLSEKRFEQIISEARAVGSSVLIGLVLDGAMEDLPL